MIKKKKKEVTIDDLSVMIREGFAKSDKRIDERFAKSDKHTDDKIEVLASMVHRGFVGVDERFDKVDKRMDILEHGQEDIKLRLDNVAYRFELKQLEERVTFLERKIAKA